MTQWFSNLVNNLFADWVAGVFGPWIGIAIIVVVIAFAIREAIKLGIAWHRHRKAQRYRTELRKFVLAPVNEMNDALNKLQWEMTHHYNDQDLNELYGQRFEHAIRVPYRNVERLVKGEADLPEIEEALSPPICVFT
jgi:ABC-type transport system involved in cytochrome bd biosynthesis fused ATPase/permease subunit